MKIDSPKYTLLFLIVLHGFFGFSQRPEPKPEFNVAKDLVMLKGNSPISYFEGKAEPDDSKFARSYNGVNYYFTSEMQAMTFDEKFEKYLPTFGGYCAYGVANEKHLDIDPENFKIYEGKLLLFLRTDEMDAKKAWETGNETRHWNDAKAMWEVLRLLPDRE